MEVDDERLRSAQGRLLPAVAGPFVGDVTHVVGIDTLRSTPLVVDEPPPPKSSLDRILGLRPGFIDVSPAELLPWRSHLVPLVSRQLVGEQLVHLGIRADWDVNGGRDICILTARLVDLRSEARHRRQ